MNRSSRPFRRTLAAVGVAALAGSTLVATSTTTAEADPLPQVCTVTKTYQNFDDTSDLTLNGDAAVFGSPAVMRVTPSENNQAGSFFTTEKISFLNDGSFSSRFDFRFSDPGGYGADGLVFVVQNVDDEVGAIGGGIGYQGIPNSVGVEFDDWYNAGIDAVDDHNHVGIDVGGSVTSDPAAPLDPLGIVLDDGEILRAWVDYDGITDTLEVRIVSTAVTTDRPVDPYLTKSIDIPAALGTVDDAYVGFTSATGDGRANHDVLNWTLNNCYQPIDTPPVVEAGGPYSGDEGSAIALAGSVTDDGPVTSAWTYAPVSADAGATCSFADAAAPVTTVTCTDDGTYTLTLTGDDGVFDPAADTAELTVGNVPPVVTSVTPTFTAPCTVSTVAAFTDAGINDTHTASLDWGDGSSDAATVVEADGAGTAEGSHTYAQAGTYTVTATVTDDNNGVGTGTESLTTLNAAAPFGPLPKATDGWIGFKINQTIPVKVTAEDCAGNTVTDLTPSIQVDQVAALPGGPVDEASIVEVSTDGKGFVAKGQHNQYNLSTKDSTFAGGGALTPGTYRITVTDPSFFEPVVIGISLR